MRKTLEETTNIWSSRENSERNRVILCFTRRQAILILRVQGKRPVVSENPTFRFVSFRDVVLGDIPCSVWHTRVDWLTISWYASEWEHSDITMAGGIHEREVQWGWEGSFLWNLCDLWDSYLWSLYFSVPCQAAFATYMPLCFSRIWGLIGYPRNALNAFLVC